MDTICYFESRVHSKYLLWYIMLQYHMTLRVCLEQSFFLIRISQPDEPLCDKNINYGKL